MTNSILLASMPNFSESPWSSSKFRRKNARRIKFVYMIFESINLVRLLEIGFRKEFFGTLWYLKLSDCFAITDLKWRIVTFGTWAPVFVVVATYQSMPKLGECFDRQKLQLKDAWRIQSLFPWFPNPLILFIHGKLEFGKKSLIGCGTLTLTAVSQLRILSETFAMLERELH